VFLFGGENAGVALSDTWLYQTELGRWRRSTSPGPAARSGAVAVYDEERSLVFLFAGVAGSEATAQFQSDVWVYDPFTGVWTQSASPGSGPSPRAYASVAYDTSIGRVLLFGGVGPNGVNLGDTWEFNPDTGAWLQRATTGPSPRGGAAMAFDTRRSRMLLAGGAPQVAGVPGPALADSWQFDSGTATWTSITTSTPPARTGHAVIYDSRLDRFELFGGTGQTPGVFGDVWEFEPSQRVWTSRAPSATSPPERAGHFALYDSRSGSAFLGFGLSYSPNGRATPAFSDLWQLESTGVWSEKQAGLAPVRVRTGLVFDNNRRRLVAAGTQPSVDRDAVWEFDARSQRWLANEPRSEAGLLSSNRVLSGPVAFDLRRQVAIFAEFMNVGGSVFAFGHGFRFWDWDGAQRRKTCEFPDLLLGGAMAYDPIHERLLSFGGRISDLAYGGPKRSAQLVQIDLVACRVEQVSVRGNAWPSARTDALATWDSPRGRLILHGGESTAANLDDTWEWNPGDGTWLKRALTGAKPPAVSGAALAFDPTRNRAVWFGGHPSTTWEFVPSAGTWVSVSTASVPTAPASLTFDAERAHIVALDADANLWDWDGIDWRQRELSVAPSARSGASGGFVPESHYGVIFGGTSGNGHRVLLSDTWVWKQGWKLASFPFIGGDSPTVERAGGPGAPPARTGHAFSVGFSPSSGEPGVGVLFGGEGETGLMSDTWIWSYENLDWRTVSGSAHPSERTEHAMAPLPGVGYLLFGGQGTTGALGDTWRWLVNTSRPTQNSWLFTGATAPAARWGHAMATDTARGVVVLFGGKNATTAFGDTWEYDERTASKWTRRAPSQSPPARFGHELSYDTERHVIVLTGGSGADSGQRYGDVWEWRADANTWVRRDTEEALPPRAGHSAFFDSVRRELIVFGGLDYAEQGRAASTYGDTLAFQNATSTGDTGTRVPQGGSCSSDAQCETGSCVDGVCCNSRCQGQCAACDVPGSVGQCVAVEGHPHGQRPACSDIEDPCHQCGGVSLDACGLPEGAACGTVHCERGRISRGQCGPNARVGWGCEFRFEAACAPNACVDDHCQQECRIDDDCDPAYFCRTSQYPVRCAPFAAITNVALPVPPARVGQEASIWGSANDPSSNTSFRFVYTQPNGEVGPSRPRCSSSFSALTSCTFVPATIGTYHFRVEVLAQGSPHVFDGSYEFDLEVGP
jgi:N-acetylneuraminic acid mutarotase